MLEVGQIHYNERTGSRVRITRFFNGFFDTLMVTFKNRQGVVESYSVDAFKSIFKPV